MKINNFNLLVALALTVFLVVFTVWFVTQERYIYFWDYATYFQMYRNLGDNARHNPLYGIGRIGNSIRNSDYNYLPTVFLVPFYLVFGNSRLAYILSVVWNFVFPSIVCLSALYQRLARQIYDSDQTRIVFVAAFAIIALLPQFWIPVFLGYVDAVGVEIIALILLVYFASDLVEKPTRELVLLGAMVCFLVLLRRWYAYWTIGFFVAVAAEQTLAIYRRRFNLNFAARIFKRIVIIGATAFVSFVVIATPIAIKMLTTDFREAFTAYRSTQSLPEHLALLINHYGALLILLAAFGFMTAAARQFLRRFAVFFAILFSVAYVLFTRVQNVDVHHYYWITPLIAFFVVVGWLEIHRQIRLRWLQNGFAALTLAIFAAQFLFVFAPAARIVLQPVGSAFSNYKLSPKQRDDLPEIQRLLDKLDALTVADDNKIYVLSSSVYLNSSILKNACSFSDAPDLNRLNARILQTNDVDLRDGFPPQILTADFLVIADPISYHLQPKDQKVIGAIAAQIFNQQDFGRFYQKLPEEFALDNNIKVSIYRKSQKFDRAALEKLSQTFIEFYPNNRDKFELTPQVIDEAVER